MLTSRARDRSWIWTALAGVLLAVTILPTADRWIHPPAFAYVWLARQARTQPLNADIYDDAMVSDALARLTGGRVHDIISPTPPSAAILLLPVAFVPDRTLAPLWCAVNAAATLLAVALLATTLRWRRPAAWSAALIVAALVAITPPLRENLARGQIYLVVLAVSALITFASVRGRDGWLSVGLAVLLLLKASGWPLWIVYASARRWRPLAWALGITASAVVIALPWVGIEAYHSWLFDVVPTWLTTPKMMVPAYQTISGFWSHLFRLDPRWNPAPLVDAPALAIAASLATIAALFLLLLRRADVLLTVAGAILIGIACQPVAEQYHYLPALVPLAVAAQVSVERRDRLAGAGVVIAALLIFGPWPFKDPIWWGGLRALVAYPRLYGGLMAVAVLLLRLADRPATETTRETIAYRLGF